MELTNLQIKENKRKQLVNAGINQVEDLMYYFPKKYINRTMFTGLTEEGESIFLFQVGSVRLCKGPAMIVEAVGTMDGCDVPVVVKWFNQVYLLQSLEPLTGSTVLVAGNAKYVPADMYYNKTPKYEIINPPVFDPRGVNALGLYPVYKKVPGMAEEYLQNLIGQACKLLGPPEETLPIDILDQYGLLSHDAMVACLHKPESEEMLQFAVRRKQWDDLLYFALRIEMNNRKSAAGSTYTLSSLSQMNQVKDSLPFRLTKGQEDALTDAIAHIRQGKRLNALVQGDVGCGKTIVALLLMIAFAGNGYQAAMMAPTKILAQQHYDKLCKLAEPLGIPVVFVSGDYLRAEEQAKLEEQLSTGSARLIVGTQALLSEKYTFQNLAFVVEDEEHRYGVVQRTALTEKAAGGTHTLTMSATPIPRTLAQTIYGDTIQLYAITDKPAGRKPILTGIAPNERKAIAFLKKNCKQGHQAYVVCPVIAGGGKMEGVASAEETFIKYRDALEPEGISVALVTGKTKAAEAKETLDAFKNGTVSVLVSTTIIEVGVDVPKANCIIIHNAERFGLAQLHQLRGRVGRGCEDSYCSLISADTENPRLQAMRQYSNGFEIAQIDLQQRGAGDFLGIQQSGTERYLAMALQNPEEYKLAQEAACDLLDRGESCLLLEKAISDREEQKGGDILC